MGQEPLFGTPKQLPRGPHQLPREEVVASQRARLLAALVDVVAESGYQHATINEIGRRAGVSPRTFYEHFDGKLACLLAAFDVFSETLTRRIAEQLGAPGLTLEDTVHRALRVYLLTLQENPAAARTFLFQMHGTDPVARARRREASLRIATALRVFFEGRHPDAPQLLPDSAYLAIVYGVREVVCDRLDGNYSRPLVELTEELSSFVLAAARGAR
ncbi:MAG TPA: TetR/AcrR family transcriptional regulator [Solirubrobacter sp.]|nr:TetR/AcrR family transcriptional regulator [Solirubrobacter sp.]